MRIDLYIHTDPDPALVAAVTKLAGKVEKMSAELDRLTAAVAAEKTADDSLIALVKGLAQQIRDNATDPAALTALADSLDSDQAEIAAAVAENTPPA